MRENMKSKLNHWLLMIALFLSASATANTNEVPKDYAYGVPLITQESEPFFRVILPDDVYEQTAWPDMRDLRVFNSQGVTVPFALYSQEAQETRTKSWPLRVFPLDAQPHKAGTQPQITLKSTSGIEVTLPLDSKKSSGRSLLLEVPQEEEDYPALSQLKLIWTRLPQNWQARVSVFNSPDLKSWNELIEDAPLMDLTSGSDRLLLDTIDLRDGRNMPHSRYFLLVFKDDAQPADLNLSAVTGIAVSGRPAQDYVTLAPSVKALSQSEAEYSWSSPQPFSRLIIKPAQSNAVLPLEIEYRSSERDSWHPLSKLGVYSVEDKESAPLELRGELIQAIRLKGINQQWSGMPPLVSGQREVRKLVFNAQGSSPFMLVWGNKTAAAQALSLDTLIPPKTHQWLTMPYAGKAQVQTLGGRERLTATTQAEKIGLWQKGLLWVLLIIGAAGLVLLAIKVWREVQRQPE
ncbi:DUF3999 family protein [Erwinia sp. J316]|uniref:DUF3999 family protein n=2 Tax=Erwinia sorbitola TaxID=2681984 RepID=A0ABW9RGB4_9GAMM|nr:DUF3999 family protein [Erwinia sorbitola]